MKLLGKIGVGINALLLISCANHAPAPVDDVQYSSDLTNKSYSFNSQESKISQKTSGLSLQQANHHKVRPGETLFAIAWKYSLDYRDLAKINGLTNFRIYPGQELILKKTYRQPVYEPRTLVAAINRDVLHKKVHKKVHSSQILKYTESVKNRSIQQDERTSKSHKSSHSHTNKHIKVNSRIADNKVKNWIWPVNGQILQGFSGKNNQNKGLDIKANLGDAVRATAPGKVVYSGNGLRGYGQLVIIKHNDSYLSAYAHNNKIYVNENEIVKAGQRIADIGKSGTEKPQLHFEIRYKGKPVNPLNYLPKAG